jgi:hypothetical protein
VVANVRNGYTKYVADKVGWPVNWWPTLQVANNILKVSNLASAPLFNDISPFSASQSQSMHNAPNIEEVTCKHWPARNLHIPFAPKTIGLL